MNVVLQHWDDVAHHNHPSISLRSGNLIDDSKKPVVFDSTEDNPSDEYLDKYIDGLAYLDFYSWIYYAPYFFKYIIKNYHINDSDRVIDGFLYNLKISDLHRERLSLLSHNQAQIIINFLNELYLIKPSYFISDLIDDWKEFLCEHDSQWGQ